MRFAYRPFDTALALLGSRTAVLLGRPLYPDYKPHVFEGNLWLSEVPSEQGCDRDAVEPQAVVTSDLATLGDLNQMNGGA